MSKKSQFTFKDHIHPLRERLAKAHPHMIRRRGDNKPKLALAVGIKDELTKAHPDVPMRLIATTLRDYCTRPSYLRAIVAGAPVWT